MDQRIKLDYHSACSSCQNVMEQMAQLSREDQLSAVDLKKHYLAIYRLVDASLEDTCILTSSAAEAVGQTIWSVYFEKSRKEGKSHFIASCIEDAPTLQMLKRCEDLGCSVSIAPVNEKGQVDIERLASLINPRTALISITMAHGLTGVIQPIDEISQLAKTRGVLLHVEASYAIGKTYFSFAESSIDYLTFSGEQIHGLKSSGALFSKRGAPLVPLILGGKSHAGLRGGAFDLSALIALSAAAALASLATDTMGLEIARLRDLFEKEIAQRVSGAKILFQDILRLPNTTTIFFPRVHADSLSYFLSRQGIEVNGSGTYSQHLHKILLACGIKEENSALSFSLSRMTTQEEIMKAVLVIQKIVERLRTVSEDLYRAGSEILDFERTKTAQISNIEQVDIVDSSEFSRGSTPKFQAARGMPMGLEDLVRSASIDVLGKKMQNRLNCLRYVGSFSSQIAIEKGMRLVIGKEGMLCFYWLVDEEDGIIADAKFQAFGSAPLIALAEVASDFVLRKNYDQASRISCELLSKQLWDEKEFSVLSKDVQPFLDQVLCAIDQAVHQCIDIPYASLDYAITPIQRSGNDLSEEILGWQELSHEQKLHILEEVMDKEIRPYIELDAGGVKIIELRENGEVHISYEGSCTTCHASTGSTLSAIQQILKGRVHPNLSVIPVIRSLA